MTANAAGGERQTRGTAAPARAWRSVALRWSKARATIDISRSTTIAWDEKNACGSTLSPRATVIATDLGRGAVGADQRVAVIAERLVDGHLGARLCPPRGGDSEGVMRIVTS